MKKRICMVIPSFDAGGVERAVAELAGYMSMIDGLEIHLLLYGIMPKVLHPLSGNVKVHQPGFIFDPNYGIHNTIKTMVFLRKRIRLINPNALLSFGEGWSSILMIALTGLNYRVFVADRNQSGLYPGILHHLLQKVMLRKAEGVIVQTRSALEIYQTLFPGQSVFRINDPVHPAKRFSAVKKENIVLSSGPLGPSNHHDELIRLFAGLNIPNWKLVIIGGDLYNQSYLKKLHKLILEIGAGNKVILAGSRMDVDSFYQKSRIFAYASTSGTFPHVLGEAMAAGLPVISFDGVARTEDVIEDGIDGFLVPINDYSRFGEKLKLLMENAELRDNMGDCAYRHIKKYQVMEIGKAYCKCLVGCLTA
jgi:GalNAc-alpha-(1->4)-GalNAc-alpha-(1->3)-diNAcBac-PP-undecaprenol alpha-1,4-N-acetyl-D-galactosaminyltransferase